MDRGRLKRVIAVKIIRKALIGTSINGCAPNRGSTVGFETQVVFHDISDELLARPRPVI